MTYLECKATTTIGGRVYSIGSLLSVPAQHDSENNDLRGVQIAASDTSFTVHITTVKAFGSSYTSGTNGANIDLSFWRLKIVGVI